MPISSANQRVNTGMGIAWWLIPLACFVVIIGLFATGYFVLRSRRDRSEVLDTKKGPANDAPKRDDKPPPDPKAAFDDYLRKAVKRAGGQIKEPSGRPVGKIVICNDTAPHQREYLSLPADLAARNAQEVDAIAVLVRSTRIIGYYTPAGTLPDKNKGEPAEQGQLVVEVIEPDSGALISRSPMYWGPMPPNFLIYRPGPVEYPYEEAGKYLRTLPRKKS